MRVWLTTTWFGLLRYFRMRVVVMLLFILPLLLIFLLGNAFSGEMKPVKITVYNGDQGHLKHAIASFLHDPALAAAAKIKEVGSIDAVRNQVQDGGADYGITIPASFSADVLAGKDANWISYPGREDTQNMVAEAVMNRFLASIQTSQAVMLAAGPKAASPENSKEGMTEASLFAAETLGTGHEEFGPVSAIQYYAGTYLIMFLLYSGMSAGISLLNDKEHGILGRLYSMPQPMWLIVLGNMTRIIIFGIIQSTVLILFSWQVYGVNWGDQMGLIALVCLLTSLAAIGLSIIIASFVKKVSALQSLFSSLTILMTFLSGGMVADLGDTVQAIGKFTINHWAALTIRQVMDDVSGAVLWHGIEILGMISLVLMAIALLRLKKVVSLDA